MPPRAIKSIFFTRFHHEKGSRVLHQVPAGSITPSSSPSSLSQPLIDFASCTTYLIPTQQFSDRLLTFCNSHHRIIGYPICIREGKYSRNEFIFNFAILVEESVGDWQAYGEVARKMGTLLRALEEQGGFLSREEDEWGVWGEGEPDTDGTVGYGMYGMYGTDVSGANSGSDSDGNGGGGVESAGWKKGGSRVHALCEMIMEDLNNYAECMIPIDDSNTINLKLFPTHPPPPPIFLNQVPLMTISLRSLTAPISSDLTLMRIVPFINGINSVAHISQLADTDLSLTRKAIQHLIYYGCLVLLDVFSFGAIYAPTAEIGGFIVERSVQDECARYVRIRRTEAERRGTKVGSESGRSRDERSSVSSEATGSRSDIASPATPSLSDTNPSRRDTKDLEHDDREVTPETLITLYTGLRQGLTLKQWVLDNIELLPNIDIRRFITFGIIKGFLYRVHKYAITTSNHLHTPPPAPPASLQSHPQSHATTPSHSSTAAVSVANSHRDSDSSTIRGHASPNQPHHLTHKASIASTATVLGPSNKYPNNVMETTANDAITRLDSIVSDDRDARESGLPLLRFLDGMHCFDEICMELGLSEKIVEKKIRGAGDVQVIYR